MKKKFGNSIDFFKNYKRISIYIITFIIIYATLATAVMTEKYDLKVGDIAPTNIKAPKEVIDQVTTELRRKEIESKVPKEYSLKPEVQKESEEKIVSFFSILEEEKTNVVDDSDDGTITNVPKDEIFNLSESDIKFLLGLSESKLQELKNYIIRIVNEAYEVPIYEDKPEAFKIVKNSAMVDISQKYDGKEKEILNTIVEASIQPNWFYDHEKTEKLIKETLGNIEPSIYKKEQTIVQEGEPVSASQLAVLNELGLLSSSKFSINGFLSLAGIVIIVMYIQYMYIKRYYSDIYNDNSKLIMISLINILTVVFGRTFTIISPYLVPLACTPILLTLLINYKAAFVISAMNVILIAVDVGFNPNVIVIALISAVLGTISLRRMQQRNDILYSTIFIAILNGIAAFSITILGTNLPEEILINSIFTVTGALLSGVLATGLLPFFESSFDVVTTVKLLELSNPNNPLLKKLLMEAPGTYHHSVLVANLAELATEAVGGNALLARIGAYYHDIGKTKRPYFFRENQIGKENPHDKISAHLSTLVIISHVKDGLELAKEYNLPKVIQDFIVTHQGDTLVKYFYLTVKNSSENPDEVKEEDFKYPGPRPESKEQGILMLADSVEAAVRSINDPTNDKIEKMVENIIKDKLSSGQLDNCELTLKDLDTIRKSFLKALNGIYHQRIEYPTDNRKKE